MVSFVVAGLGCALAAFCYAEFASMAPVAGSAYTYAYATLGELIAWIIGWDLILEYAMSCATVGGVWAKYFNEFLDVARSDCAGPGPFVPRPVHARRGPGSTCRPCSSWRWSRSMLVIGIRESAASNTVLVLIKLGVVLFVIAVGRPATSTKANWTDIPPEARKSARGAPSSRPSPRTYVENERRSRPKGASEPRRGAQGGGPGELRGHADRR